jgi:hypothetical protein
MQYLKALVIGMGILIVLGMALLVYGFVAKSKSKSKVETNTITETEGMIKGFGDVILNQPQDCENIGVMNAGRRLIIEFGPRSNPQCAKIIVLDIVTGETLGTISVHK